MKFIHLSDLHLGKRVDEFSMIEDQEHILLNIINIIDDEKPQAVVIAGDIFDKGVPSEEAVKLWDDFLYRLAKRKLQVFAISGNHDSAVRFSAHNELVDITGIHLAPVYDGKVEPYILNDEQGEVRFFMLPFIKPANVRAIFKEEEIKDYTDACRIAISHMNIDEKVRNVLVAHQFVAGANICDSEESSVGGLDNVAAEVFYGFDYVALGHLHGPQNVGRESIRYCGTPLKYSFSEIKHNKSVTVVELGKKGDLSVRTRELMPLHDMREIRGDFETVSSQDFCDGDVEDYLRIILTDEEDVPDAMNKLRKKYKNIMKLSYDNTRTRSKNLLGPAENIKNKTEIELFEELFRIQNGCDLSDEQKKFMVDLIEAIKGGQQ